jgi:tetratricopeptide (TPR) repeat protein
MTLEDHPTPVVEPRARDLAWLFAALVLTTLSLWPGLHGPFVLDDIVNLLPVTDWIHGQIGAEAVIFGNDSGPLGRPLAMASFVLNAALGADAPFGFKLGNLILHLLTGMVIYALLSRLARRDPVFRALGPWVPLGVTTLWLLHPMLVGTVLYVIQRMAMLSALFMLLAVLAYVIGRERLEHGESRSGMAWILLGVPLATVLATLSKENGALAPLLCAAVEAGYFRPAPGRRRPWIGGLTLWGGLVATVLAFALALAIRPDALFAQYAQMPFTMAERWLSQGPVLLDYLRSLVLPAGPTFSLFRDDYPVSRGWLDPPYTLVAWSVLAALAVAAWLLRRRNPAFATGLAIFAIGHLVESTFLPLHLYFEHRNYLPAVGVLWALAGLLVAGGRMAAAHMHNAPRIFAGAAILLVLAFAAGAHGRAGIWQSRETLIAQTLENYPNSRFARFEAAYGALGAEPPNLAIALAHFEQLTKSSSRESRIGGHLGAVLARCQLDGAFDRNSFEMAIADFPATIEADVALLIQFIARQAEEARCDGFPFGRFAQWITRSVDMSGLPAQSKIAWGLRYSAAGLMQTAGDLPEAIAQAEKAWHSGAASPPVGLLLAQLYLDAGRIDEADATLGSVETRIDPTDTAARRTVATIRRGIDERRALQKERAEPTEASAKHD